MKRIALLISFLISLGLITSCSNYSSGYKPSYAYATPTPYENFGKYLIIEFLNSELSYEYYTLTYKITNNSYAHKFTYIKVNVSLLNSGNSILASKWTYAVDSVPLVSGASQEFDVMIKKPSSDEVKNVQCQIIDYK